MTKTTTVPHLLEQLSVELHANGVKFDTATAYGVKVNLVVRFEPVSEQHDEPHFVVEKVRLALDYVLFSDGTMWLDMQAGTDVADLIPKSQVAAIEENLLAQMGGAV